MVKDVSPHFEEGGASERRVQGIMNRCVREV